MVTNLLIIKFGNFFSHSSTNNWSGRCRRKPNIIAMPPYSSVQRQSVYGVMVSRWCRHSIVQVCVRNFANYIQRIFNENFATLLVWERILSIINTPRIIKCTHTHTQHTAMLCTLAPTLCVFCSMFAAKVHARGTELVSQAYIKWLDII